MIGPAQIRAARALLGWSQSHLARVAAVGIATIQRIEGRPRTLGPYAATLEKIQATLEASGVTFLPVEPALGLGAGVRFSRPIEGDWDLSETARERGTRPHRNAAAPRDKRDRSDELF